MCSEISPWAPTCNKFAKPMEIIEKRHVIGYSENRRTNSVGRRAETKFGGIPAIFIVLILLQTLEF